MITGILLAVLAYYFGKKFKRKVKVPEKVKETFSKMHPSASDVSWYSPKSNQFEAYFDEAGCKKSAWYDESAARIF